MNKQLVKELKASGLNITETKSFKEKLNDFWNSIILVRLIKWIVKRFK